MMTGGAVEHLSTGELVVLLLIVAYFVVWGILDIIVDAVRNSEHSTK